MSEDKILKPYATPAIIHENCTCNQGMCGITGDFEIVLPTGYTPYDKPSVHIEELNGGAVGDADVGDVTVTPGSGTKTYVWPFTYDGGSPGTTYKIGGEVGVTIGVPATPVKVSCP